MYRKRQVTIVSICVAFVAVYFLLHLLPVSTRTILALAGVPFALLLAAFFVGYVRIRNSRLRYVYLALPVLGLAISVLLFFPDYRRIVLRRSLEALGARVTLEFDEAYPHVPRWLKDELDWAFLGQIKQVDFGRKPVPVTELGTLSFPEPIWFLNLEGSEISRDGLSQLADVLDVEVVNLSRTPADNTSLEAFAQMPSIKRIYAVNSNVTTSDAKYFRLRNPKIELIIDLIPVGSSATINSTEP